MKRVRLELAFDDKIDLETYRLYADMRVWIKDQEVDGKFIWRNSGNYFPNAIEMEEDSAIAFKLRYNAI